MAVPIPAGSKPAPPYQAFFLARHYADEERIARLADYESAALGLVDAPFTRESARRLALEELEGLAYGGSLN